MRYALRAARRSTPRALFAGIAFWDLRSGLAAANCLSAYILDLDEQTQLNQTHHYLPAETCKDSTGQSWVCTGGPDTDHGFAIRAVDDLTALRSLQKRSTDWLSEYGRKVARGCWPNYVSTLTKTGFIYDLSLIHI